MRSFAARSISTCAVVPVLDALGGKTLRASA
jgi:hypothetical protein